MRTIFLIILLFNSQLILSQGRWEQIQSPTTSFLRNITKSDSNTLWASGHNGTIIKSTDQGNNWTVLQTNTNNIIMNLSAVSNQLVYALTWNFDAPPYGTYILKTSDGGSSWHSRFFPIEFEFLQSIFFFNENLGLVAGSKTYLTTDGGLSWTQAQRDSDLVANLPFLNIKMFNNNLGFACGGFRDVAGIIWKTTNGGLNWITNGISPDEIFDFAIIDSLNIIALSGDPEFLYQLAFVKSTDGGNNWQYIELPYYAVSLGFDILNNNTFWAAAGYKFIYSTDSGVNWYLQNTPDSTIVYDLIFINNQKGFACGANGVLLKYIPATSNINFSTSKPFDFNIIQNFPNPFNLSTIIKWQSSVDGHTNLKIFDILGNEVASLVDDYKSAGDYEIVFVANNLSSGIYICSLRINGFSQHIKMVLQK